MNYPQLSTQTIKRTMINTFSGYDHRLVTSDTTFYDMQNMCTGLYPAISTRPKRAKVSTLTDARGLIAKDSLCWIDGNALYYNGNKITGITLNGSTPKQMVSMGAYLVIFPDAVYVNTKDLNEYGSLGASYELPADNTVTVTVSRQDGTEYENLLVSNTPPENAAVGDYWIDTSESPSVLKMYTYEEIWADVPVSYCTVKATGIGAGFKSGDGLTVTATKNLGGALPFGEEGNYSATLVMSAVTDDTLTFAGIMNTAQVVYNAGDITLKAERRIPKMDYVVESQNRLWGCYYGLDDEGKTLNEIYASALGDPKNWQIFQGTAADSYIVSLGSDGVFTGAASYQNRPVFFKEQCIHTVYGDYPANYTMHTASVRGVQKGSWRSVANIGGVLYYKSPTDICAYDGSIPVSISAQLGDDNAFFSHAVAGANGTLLYIALRSGNTDTMYVYDTQRGIWSKEDEVTPIAFASDSSGLYYITQNALMRTVYTQTAGGTPEQEDIEWSLTTGIHGFENPDGKRLRQLKLNMLAEEDTACELEVMYDSSGAWLKIADCYGSGLTKCTSVIFIPQLCDHFQLRLSGYGYMHLVSVTKSVLYGGEKR